MKAITHQLALRRFAAAILCILALPLIHFVSRSNYNLFHAFADGASIVIAAATFAIIWNSRHRVENDYFLFTGIAFLFFSFLDAMHVLGNKNMGVFPAYGNLGPTFYIASRYLLSVSLLCAPLLIHRRLKAPVVFGACALFCALVVLSVFHWKVFPVCIVEGVGLTPFKVVSDYIICLILAGSIVLLLRHRESFDPRVLRIIVASIVLSIATGLTFTLYTDPFGITNMIGHLFQLASFYMVYMAFIETSLTKPHEILFRELKQNEEKLVQNLQELDDANIELNREIAERKLAEDALRKSEAKLRAVFRALGQGIVLLNTKGEVVEVGDSVENLHGHTFEELSAPRLDPRRHIIRPDGTPFPVDEQPAMVALRTGEALRDVEMGVPISDGSLRWRVVNAQPVYDDLGNLLGAVESFFDISERKRLEVALRESEERFRLALRNAPVSVAVQDLDLRYIWAYNQRTARPDQIIGHFDHEIFTAEEAAHVTAVKRRVIEEGVELRDQMRFNRPSGRIFLDVCWTPLRDSAGRVTGVASATVDLTPIKLAEEALRESETRFRTLYESMAEGVALHEIIYDESGEAIDYRIISANPAYEKHTGLEPDQVEGKLASEAYGMGHAPYIDEFALVAQSGNPCSFETYFPPMQRHFHISVSSPARNQFVTVFEDITERKRMEEELRKSRDELELRIQERTAELARTNVALFESERKFRLIAETVEDVFWMNLPGAEVMVYVSPAYEKIWGRSVEDLYRNPKSFIETIHPEDREVVLSAIEKHRRGEGDHIEYRIVRPDETIRWISDRAYPVHDAAGKVQMMVGIAADITDSKEAEERLRMYAEELERTNRDLSDFSHIAAHDLQEPLRLLVTLGDRLAATCAHCRKNEAQYFIERIQQSAKRSSTFIRDILKYSTVSSHKAAFLETDLNKVVLDVLEEFEEVVEQAGGVMEVGELASLEADRGQIADVFRNLVANALKFSGSEKPRIRIYGEPAGGGKQYRICVEDNGIGFDEAYLDKIFTPFQRLHGKTKFEGSGIGLALCRKIVERHGGSITAKSKPNEGSTFILTLPLSQRGGGGEI